MSSRLGREFLSRRGPQSRERTESSEGSSHPPPTRGKLASRKSPWKPPPGRSISQSYLPVAQLFKTRSVRGTALPRLHWTRAQIAAATERCGADFLAAKEKLQACRDKREEDLSPWEKDLAVIETRLREKTSIASPQLLEERRRLAKEIKLRVLDWLTEINVVRKGFMERWEPIPIGEMDIFAHAKVVAERHLCLWFEPLYNVAVREGRWPKNIRRR